MFFLFPMHVPLSLLMQWQCLSVPILFIPTLPFLLSLSHLSIFSCLCGDQKRASLSPLIGRYVKLLGAMKACITQRMWDRKGGEEECGAWGGRRWNVLTFAFWKGWRWGWALRMPVWNNGSRSQLHGFLNPGALPLGNGPADPVPVSSDDLGLLALIWRWRGDLHSGRASLPRGRGGVHKGKGKAWLRGNSHSGARLSGTARSSVLFY